MTPSELDELLGAWALDALDRDTSACVDRLISLDPELAARARRLEDVVAGLHGSDAAAPPAYVRPRILDAAAGRPRALEPRADVIDLFTSQVEKLRELLASLTPQQWHRRARPYAWTVHELVAHLLVIEGYTAEQLGLAGNAVRGTVPEKAGHLAMGADVIASEAGRAPIETMTAWHERRDRDGRRASSGARSGSGRAGGAARVAVHDDDGTGCSFVRGLDPRR